MSQFACNRRTLLGRRAPSGDVRCEAVCCASDRRTPIPRHAQLTIDKAARHHLPGPSAGDCFFHLRPTDLEARGPQTRDHDWHEFLRTSAREHDVIDELALPGLVVGVIVLGHKSAKTTPRYAMVAPKKLAAAADMLQRAWHPEAGSIDHEDKAKTGIR